MKTALVLLLLTACGAPQLPADCAPVAAPTARAEPVLLKAVVAAPEIGWCSQTWVGSVPWAFDSDHALLDCDLRTQSAGHVFYVQQPDNRITDVRLVVDFPKYPEQP
jgi:hypothetical protein